MRGSVSRRLWGELLAVTMDMAHAEDRTLNPSQDWSRVILPRLEKADGDQSE